MPELSGADGLVRLYRGGTIGTPLATSSSGFPGRGKRWSDANITSSTTGRSRCGCEDSTPVLTYSGDITADNAHLNVLSFQLGINAIPGAAASTSPVAFDDVAINSNTERATTGGLAMATSSCCDLSQSLTASGFREAE